MVFGDEKSCRHGPSLLEHSYGVEEGVPRIIKKVVMMMMMMTTHNLLEHLLPVKLQRNRGNTGVELQILDSLNSVIWKPTTRAFICAYIMEFQLSTPSTQITTEPCHCTSSNRKMSRIHPLISSKNKTNMSRRRIYLTGHGSKAVLTRRTKSKELLKIWYLIFFRMLESHIIPLPRSKWNVKIHN